MLVKLFIWSIALAFAVIFWIGVYTAITTIMKCDLASLIFG
jgi:hypothetical protein